MTYMAAHEWITLIGAVFALLASLSGWAYQIGVQATRTARTELDVKMLNDRILQHHERTDIHVSEEWRTEVRDVLRRMEDKMDRLPCKMFVRSCQQTED
jgi:hypothetical protein